MDSPRRWTRSPPTGAWVSERPVTSPASVRGRPDQIARRALPGTRKRSSQPHQTATVATNLQSPTGTETPRTALPAGTPAYIRLAGATDSTCIRLAEDLAAELRLSDSVPVAPDGLFCLASQSSVEDASLDPRVALATAQPIPDLPPLTEDSDDPFDPRYIWNCSFWRRRALSTCTAGHDSAVHPRFRFRDAILPRMIPNARPPST